MPSFSLAFYFEQILVGKIKFNVKKIYIHIIYLYISIVNIKVIISQLIP